MHASSSTRAFCINLRRACIFRSWPQTSRSVSQKRAFSQLKNRVFFLFPQQLYFLGFLEGRASTSVERAFCFSAAKNNRSVSEKRAFFSQLKDRVILLLFTTSLFSRLSNKSCINLRTEKEYFSDLKKNHVILFFSITILLPRHQPPQHVRFVSTSVERAGFFPNTKIIALFHRKEHFVI